MTHAILRVLASVPINKNAARVTNQRYCAALDSDLSRAEAIALLERLHRKQRLLKSMLQIKTVAQHTNALYRHRHGYRSNFRPQRILAEYVLNGQNIFSLCQRVAVADEDKTLRKKIGAIENAWRAEHPGCIWTGVVLVAPNGAVFDRKAALQSIAEQVAA